MNPNEVRESWAERSGEYSPDYYAHYGPNETSESIRSYLDSHLGSNAAILELGCSSGRHLAYLLENGYENLFGIEINDEAFEVMDDTYPDLAKQGTFYHDAIENVVGDFEDGQFDAVFSVETLQHLHPDDEWVFTELARITDDLLITVENEGSDAADGHDSESAELGVNYVNDDFPLYYRNWNRIFTDLGLTEVDSEVGEQDTVRVFRTSGK
ncbi:Methyltransferase domain-containing protein [Haladaptatus litoreus]|uniref:Methyltransferase domain-containing protein n=1 Tax=Haladaptatus litoreus TaxID=553468 RepID=A0A1N6X0A0_9EURY|nr:class I SAM-dependent methyltransferase [Haladaptatus litoreus]SIQ95772.1 Methyltransferase domain-containing protein [Haladaptatus litoreus]